MINNPLQSLLEDLQRERDRKERKRAERIDEAKFWGKILGSSVVASAALIGIIFLICTGFDAADGINNGNSADHYNNDFKVFCSQLHGTTIIDDVDLCLAKDKTILMREHDPSEDDHYNNDFKRFCEARGGVATVGVAHDFCIKDSKLIMREGKYNA